MKDKEENKNAFPDINISHVSSCYLNGTSSLETFHKDPKIQALVKELVNAFTEWGFVYLTGHGIDQELINDAFESSRQFFMLEKHVKEMFSRPYGGTNFGWVPFNVETFEKSRPFDIKECFNFIPNSSGAEELHKFVPEFIEVQSKFYNSCRSLCEIIIRLINLALPTSDLEFLSSQHQNISNDDFNPSITRLLYYPPVESRDGVLENQLRCGEHSDYGTFTLLFQDQAGGLQVVSPSGDYVDATPIPGRIVLNVGDMLEIWSSRKFKSTRHRVVVPSNCNTPRQSITFFLHPDNDAMVSCLDGSDKYAPVIAGEYLQNKFSQTYI